MDFYFSEIVSLILIFESDLVDAVWQQVSDVKSSQLQAMLHCCSREGCFPITVQPNGMI